MTSPSVEESIASRKLFRNKNGKVSEILRLREGETLEAGVTRLKFDGWEVPDLTQLVEDTDPMGKIIRLK